jgi:hypothetical protein
MDQFKSWTPKKYNFLTADQQLTARVHRLYRTLLGQTPISRPPLKGVASETSGGFVFRSKPNPPLAFSSRPPSQGAKQNVVRP